MQLASSSIETPPWQKSRTAAASKVGAFNERSATAACGANGILAGNHFGGYIGRTMSIPTLNRAEVRRVDQIAIEQFGVPGVVLMENAGRGCVETLMELGVSGPVVICCGKGNNAGDGLVMARHLELRGIVARLAFWSDPGLLQGDAAVNYQIAQRSEHQIHILEGAGGQLAALTDDAEWIVDALLGTGARGAPRAPLNEVIEQLNDCPCRKLALDLPSGLDCDTGDIASPTFRADHTCAFVAAKPGLVLESSAAYVGQLHIIDIGAPRILLREFGIAK
jgi:NAD(P)H-hydrate epimerase